MNDSYPWYGLARDDRLLQGDLFQSCPTYRSTPDGRFFQDTNDVIVLSQSCDLAHDKLDVVQVCPYWKLETLATRAAILQGSRGREQLRHGNLPGYHLLNQCNFPGFETDFLVCDFRSLFGIHLASLKSLAAAQSPRLRLLPSYREHLAQAFARFFMRVGLPVDVPAFR